MWVYSKFQGDIDKKIMLIQHDCYWSTLSLIRNLIKRNFHKTNPSEFIELPNIDHRTIQSTHDILAAAFRCNFKYSSTHDKHIEDKILGVSLQWTHPKENNDIIQEWHGWLEGCFDGENEIIAEFITIYLNQNSSIGYEAEDRLEALIIRKFPNVPWNEVEAKNVDDEISNEQFTNFPNKKIAVDLNNKRTEVPKRIEILEAEHEEIIRSIERLKENGVDDNYFLPGELNWLPKAFNPNHTGWSDYSKYNYKHRKAQLDPRLPIGAGYVYVLGVFGSPNLSKIGYTTLSAHQRAKDYGKVYDLNLFVYESIPSENAKALEKWIHKNFQSKIFRHYESKEIFSVDPATASAEIRKIERVATPELLSRELQWLHLEELLVGAKIAKEQWKIVSDIKLEMKREINSFAFSSGISCGILSIEEEKKDEDMAQKFEAREIKVSAYLEYLLREQTKQPNRIFKKKVSLVKAKIKEKSKNRWNRRYQTEIKKRNKSIGLLITILVGVFGIFVTILIRKF